MQEVAPLAPLEWASPQHSSASQPHPGRPAGTLRGGCFAVKETPVHRDCDRKLAQRPVSEPPADKLRVLQEGGGASPHPSELLRTHAVRPQAAPASLPVAHLRRHRRPKWRVLSQTLITHLPAYHCAENVTGVLMLVSHMQ